MTRSTSSRQADRNPDAPAWPEGKYTVEEQTVKMADGQGHVYRIYGPHHNFICRIDGSSLQPDWDQAAKAIAHVIATTLSGGLPDGHPAREALQPFADFADMRRNVPGDFIITQGSSLAKRQLKMADCYRARAALASGRE